MTLVAETRFSIYIIDTMTDLGGPKCGPRLIFPEPGQAKNENKPDAKNIYIISHPSFSLFAESVDKLGLEGKMKGGQGDFSFCPVIPRSGGRWETEGGQ